MPTARDIAVEAAHLCDEKGGEGIRVLSMGPGAEFDMAVLVTAGSERQTGAIADEIWQFAKKGGLPHRPVEGEAGWMLVDLFDVVVHVLGAPQRDFYQIDRLWAGAEEVPWQAAWAAIKAERAKPAKAKRAAKATANPDRPAKAKAKKPAAAKPAAKRPRAAAKK